VICDNALLNAMALTKKRVDRALVVEVCRDLRLKGESSPFLPPSTPEREPVVDARAAQTVEDEPASEQRPSRFPFRFGPRSALRTNRIITS
jgi:hypothetical protein